MTASKTDNAHFAIETPDFKISISLDVAKLTRLVQQLWLRLETDGNQRRKNCLAVVRHNMRGGTSISRLDVGMASS
jgi:hypothetical protein